MEAVRRRLVKERGDLVGVVLIEEKFQDDIGVQEIH